jgi:hypothetical protein
MEFGNVARVGERAVPLALNEPGVAAGEVAHLGEDQADGAFRHRAGEAARCVQHGDATLGGAGDIDVLGAAAQNGDDLKLLRCLDERAVKRGELHDHDVEVRQGRPQLRRQRHGVRAAFLDGEVGVLEIDQARVWPVSDFDLDAEFSQ